MAQFDLLEGWSGSASLGALFTGGNSDTSSINGSASVSKQINLWRHTAFGSTFSADSNNEDTADRFDIGYKVDRQFTETWYGFGRLRYDTDDFGNIDNRYSGVAGVGNKLLDDGKQFLSGEVGVGFHDTEYDRPLGTDPVSDEQEFGPDGLPIVTVPVPVDGDLLEDDGAVLYGGLNYTNILNEIVTFNSVFNIEIAESNTLTVWDNSLNVALTPRIGLSFGILARNNSDIEGQLGDNLDTATRLNLVFGI